MSRWFETHRQQWIDTRLTVHGFINRAHLMDHFGISQPQASKDLQRFQRQHPTRLTYNLTRKRYEAKRRRGTPMSDMDIPSALREELRAAADEFGCTYEWLCNIYRRGQRETTPGATGSKPLGHEIPNDLGELRAVVHLDRVNNIVQIDFGKPVAWLALSADHADQFAQMLIAQAAKLRRTRS